MRARLIPLVLLVAALVAPSSSATAADREDWRGDRQAKPSAYAWLNDYTPSDTYTVALVRGLRPKAVLRTLGGVRRDLDGRTPQEAEEYVFDHMSDDYEGPPVVQVERHGKATVVYLPYNFVPDRLLARLSRRGVVTAFSTTVEQDTYLTVAKKGRIIRRFDAGFRPPRKGALRQEKGLDWGKRDQNIWATAWAFNERVGRTHVSQEWFQGDHPTYVLRKDLY
ncbi:MULTISPECIES: DUF6461 domain-containing protein [unclassified Nocardioides]|uniref:DUF6461 domain-containing protein n=1 Tax=unclassified Nocardioides TaxID=2615069 RepID=UPI003014C65B